MASQLNFNHLHYFHVVAREGSLRAAADRLHVTQPTISEQVRTLESVLGTELFDRRGGRLQLNESGRALRSAIAPTASAGWRVIRVTCAAGSDAVGILSAVCRPLAALPLMNVSTLDANFLLVEGRHLEAALELLREAGSTVACLS